MEVADSFLVFKLVLVGGLALWATMGVLNNIVAFASGVASVGRTMTMQALDVAPAIKTPLQSRKVDSLAWHRLAYTSVLVLEAITGLLFWYSVIAFAAALLAAGSIETGIAHANLAFAALAVMAFFMTLGGQWFAYFIRQDVLHLTHLAWIAIAILGAIVVNVRGV